MKECAGKLFRRIGARLKKGAVLGTGAVLIASQVLSIVPAPTAAYAASSETITRGERVNYGGFYMYNSTTSEGTPAICLDPGKRHPLDASTAQAQLPIESDWSKCYTGGGGEQTKIDRLDGMARVLYYGPTGPGFEEAKAKGLWNFNWYDGTPLDYSKMLAIQHIALSALSKSSSQYGMQGTTAEFRNWCYGADGDHELLASNQAEIVDSVSYKGLKKGTEYELQGTLMDAETGEALKGMDGKEITATAKFTPKASSGKQKVKFKFDATLLGGHKAVVFERLYLDGKIQATHEDPEDEDQTVEYLPVEIGTTATDAADGDKAIGVGKAVTVEDEVSYKNLATGREYTVTGTLMDSATGEPIKDAEGNTVTASTTFEPEDTVGKVKVTFSVDTSTLSNKKLVVFEKLEADGNVIARHEDLTDEGQTVEVIPPEIKTSAADGADGDKEVTAEGKATIVDTVKYTGLVPGTEYELRGTLMDAETGVALRGADGKGITASAKFTPQAQDGTQDVTFAFDASALGGAKTVVFEKLFVDGTLIGSHEDPTDKDQTVEISPSLKTTAATIQGSKVVKPEDEVAIVDTVHLKGLRPGQSYTLTASINKKADGTQLTLADVKDTSNLAGNGIQKGSDTAESNSGLSKALVDVTGTGSFVNIPKGAKLTKNDDGTYTLTVPGATQDAADIVTKLSGGQVKLVPAGNSDKAEGDSTAAGTESNGKGSTLGTYEVIANGQVRFTPTVSDLDVDVPMVFKASDVAGQQAVVFESLQRDSDGREISKETDLQDTDQTIDIENTPEGKNLEQTGNWVLYLAIAAGVAACIAAIFLISRKRKI